MFHEGVHSLSKKSSGNIEICIEDVNGFYCVSIVYNPFWYKPGYQLHDKKIAFLKLRYLEEPSWCFYVGIRSTICIHSELNYLGFVDLISYGNRVW